MAKWVLFILLWLLPLATYADSFALHSTSFNNQSAMPPLYTCDGKNISPHLSWTAPPAKTQAYALIMLDPDAPSGIWYHWLLYNLPASTTQLPAGVTNLPANTQSGKNSWNNLIYNGPCPPKGKMHHYIFTLYALGAPIKLPSGMEGSSVETALKKHILAKTQLVTTYSH